MEDFVAGAAPEADAVGQCPVARRARTNPDAVAIRVDGPAGLRLVDYAELHNLLSQGALQLGRAGLRPGDVLAIDIADSLDLLLHLWAGLRAGLTVCPLNARKPPAALDTETRLAGADALIGPPERELEHSVFGTRAGASIRTIGPLFGSSSVAAVAPDPDLDLGGDLFQDAGTALFTSGSSGPPKGVVHHVSAHVYSAIGSNRNITLSPGDSWGLLLPLHHVSGFSIPFRCFLAGATVAIPRTGASMSEALNRLRFSHVSVVATQLARLLDDPAAPDDLHGLRALVGGSAIPPGLLHSAAGRGATVYATYGLTEAASQVTTTNGQPADSQTAGLPLDFREIRIADDGAVCVRGRTLLERYLTEDGPRVPLDSDGWFRTADIGFIDNNGRLTVTGRLDRVFISGGENISPEEVEARLVGLPGVSRVAMVPVSDSEFGARPVLFVDPAPDVQLVAMLRDTIRHHFPRYTLPEAVWPFPDDAETAISKVDYRRLIEYAETSKSDKSGR